MKGFKKEDLQKKFKDFYWSHHDKKIKAFSIAESILKDMSEEYQNFLLMTFDFDLEKAYIKINLEESSKIIIMNIDGYILLKDKPSPEEIKSIKDSIKIFNLNE